MDGFLRVRVRINILFTRLSGVEKKKEKSGRTLLERWFRRGENSTLKDGQCAVRFRYIFNTYRESARRTVYMYMCMYGSTGAQHNHIRTAWLLVVCLLCAGRSRCLLCTEPVDYTKQKLSFCFGRYNIPLIISHKGRWSIHRKTVRVYSSDEYAARTYLFCSLRLRVYI